MERSEKLTKQKMMRRYLKVSIKQQLVPLFLQAGFEVIPLSQEDKRTELAAIYPVGRLRRERNGKFDIVDIALSRYNDVSFTMSAGTTPKGRMVCQHGACVDSGDMWASQLDSSYAFLRSSFFWLGFKPGRRDRQDPKQENVDVFVRLLGEKLVAEIDIALRTGRKGPHTSLRGAKPPKSNFD